VSRRKGATTARTERAKEILATRDSVLAECRVRFEEGEFGRPWTTELRSAISGRPWFFDLDGNLEALAAEVEAIEEVGREGPLDDDQRALLAGAGHLWRAHGATHARRLAADALKDVYEALVKLRDAATHARAAHRITSGWAGEDADATDDEARVPTLLAGAVTLLNEHADLFAATELDEAPPWLDAHPNRRQRLDENAERELGRSLDPYDLAFLGPLSGLIPVDLSPTGRTRLTVHDVLERERGRVKQDRAERKKQR
jgi:hypothetical protein